MTKGRPDHVFLNVVSSAPDLPMRLAEGVRRTGTRLPLSSIDSLEREIITDTRAEVV